MRARIAGRVTPSSQSGSGHYLEMVELPLPRQACYISICNSTGNLVVSGGGVVSIYVYCTKLHDISRQQFQDFELFVNVHFAFLVKEVMLCKDILACMSNNEVQVVRLYDTHSEMKTFQTSSQKETNPSCVVINDNRNASNDMSNFTDDRHFLYWNFESNEINYDGKTCSNLEDKCHSDSWPLTIHLPSLMQQTDSIDYSKESREVIGPTRSVPGRPVKVEPVGSLSQNVPMFGLSSKACSSCLTILYRRFTIKISSELEDPFTLHSLHLVPIYASEDNSDNRAASKQRPLLSAGNPLRSENFCNLSGMICSFSSSQESYIYEVNLPKEKQTNCTVLLQSIIPFKSSVALVIIDNHVLHAVSASGLETYTLGLLNLLSLQNYDGDLHSSDSVCLLGFCPFLQVKHAIWGNNHLLLFSASGDEAAATESNVAWTAYDLQCSSTVQLYEDLVDGALLNKYENPTLYAFILSEIISIINFQRHKQLLYDPKLEKAICDLSLMLADFYMRTSTDYGHHLALRFFQRSKMALEEIVKRIFTIDYEESVDMKRRITILLLQIFTDRKIEFIDNYLSQDMADTVLDFIYSEDPSQLSYLILKSKYQGYDKAKFLGILRKIIQKKSEVEDVLAACTVSMHMGAVDNIPALLASLPIEKVVKVSSTFPQVWVDDCHHCTLVFQILQQLKPDGFVQILLNLISAHILPPTFMTDLCKGNWEELGLAPLKDFVLEYCLECFLINDKQNRSIFPEVTMALIEIYLSKLNQTFFSENPPTPLQTLKPWNMFGQRKFWLNDLDPFLGQSFQVNCSAMEIDETNKSDSESDDNTSNSQNQSSCPCVKCNDYLLRLQSLLCSSFSTPEIKNKVHQSVKSNCYVKGRISLQLLTCSCEDAINIIVEHLPMTLRDYGKDNFRDMELWKIAFTSLYNKFRQLEIDSESYLLYFAAVQGILSYIAETLTIKDFLAILPEVSNKNIFVDHLKRCLTRKQAEDLKNQIMKKGQELKMCV